MKKFFVLFVFLSACFSVYADNYFQDTLWMKKTDQANGFYTLKFSQNDSIIVGFGLEKTMFYDAKTGNEINRIDGNGQGMFINNDKYFIRIASGGNKIIEILDTKTWQRIDSLVNDDIQIGHFEVSKDEKILLAVTKVGLRVWDLQTKKVLKTMVLESEPNLIYNVFDNVVFACEENKFIGHRVKTYEDPNHPGDNNYYKTYGGYNIYNLNTFDSVGTFLNARGFIKSKNCKYYVFGTNDNNNGVEIYDFQSKQLLYKLPVNGLNITGIEFTNDEKYLMTADQYNNMNTWEVSNGKPTFEYVNGCTSNFNISHNQKYIIWSCSNLISLYNTHYNTSSITNPTESTNIIFPNPTSGLVTISTNCILPQVQYSIINLSGQVLNTSIIQNTNNQIRLNFSQYQNGVYYVRIQCNQETINYKIIKE